MDTLPNDCINIIFNFIPKRDLVFNVALVCKDFHQLVKLQPNTTIIEIQNKISRRTPIQDDTYYTGYILVRYLNFKTSVKWSLKYSDQQLLERIDDGEPVDFSPYQSTKSIPKNGLLCISDKYFIVKDSVWKHELNREDANELYYKICNQSFKNRCRPKKVKYNGI